MTDVERVRLLEKDHKPDGLPAVEMALLSRLADGITEIAERLKESESERMEQSRLLGMGGEREAKLISEKAALEHQVNALIEENNRRCREIGLCAKVQERLAKERDELRGRLERAKNYAHKLYGEIGSFFPLAVPVSRKSPGKNRQGRLR